MSRIVSIKAVEILDSRGNPTLQVSVYTDQQIVGTAAIPFLEMVDILLGNEVKFLQV